VNRANSHGSSSVLRRIVGLVCGFAAAVLLITLAVINRHPVKLVLDPFAPQDPILALHAPFYGYLLAMLIVGVIAGGTATWLSQGVWRRIAKSRAQEAARWKAEAERLTRERDQNARKRLAIAGR
jgi:uncharacterized integral membrane protein